MLDTGSQDALYLCHVQVGFKLVQFVILVTGRQPAGRLTETESVKNPPAGQLVGGFLLCGRMEIEQDKGEVPEFGLTGPP